MGIPYDSTAFGVPLSRAMEMLDYEGLRTPNRNGARIAGTRKRIGGVCCYVDSAGLGPSSVLARTLYEQGGWNYGSVRVLASGTVEVLTGTSAQGQGHGTAFAQLAADALGVDLTDVRVLHGDTALVPLGTGTFSSRSLIVGGTAIVQAAERVIDKARGIAAHLLEVDAVDVDFSHGRFSVAGAPESEQALMLRDVARAAHLAWDLPDGIEPGLEASAVFHPTDWTYPFGTHVAVVEVDMDTGEARVIRYVAVDDCGNVVNPTIVEGQIHGGVAQGIGQALFEEIRYSLEGQLDTGSFLSYLLPSAAELPTFELDRTVTPTTLNPLGAKGVGGGNPRGASAAMNRGRDALQTDGEIDMPATPERTIASHRHSLGACGSGADRGRTDPVGHRRLPTRPPRCPSSASRSRVCFRFGGEGVSALMTSST
ncbi:MAG: molybdopterin cofactor-binding domain-containing protein [Actinomycetota bacterium]